VHPPDPYVRPPPATALTRAFDGRIRWAHRATRGELAALGTRVRGASRGKKGPGVSMRRVPFASQLIAADARARLPVMPTTTDSSARRSQQKQHDSDHEYHNAKRPQDRDLRNETDDKQYTMARLVERPCRVVDGDVTIATPTASE
jgi:hypothetical protein